MATGLGPHDHYTVGWVCSLPMEHAAATAMLDERHADLPKPPNDDNTYTLGSIGKHNIVIACPPKGEIGTSSAAIVARMAGTFLSIKVGIGGIAYGSRNIRLRDVVVGTPASQFPDGVAQWVSGMAKEGGNIERTGALDHPSTSLLPSIHFRSPIPLAERNVRKVSDFTSGLKQHFVEGDVDGTPVEAFPDSGADMCFISPKLASGLGLGPAAGTQKRIHLANKKHIQSPGMVEVPWRFAREQKAHILNCWILPGCVHDLVLGNHFLRATHTLTKFTRRIKSKLVELPRRLRLSLLGEEKQRLWGSLDGHLTAALPDTGSDVMLISSAYARKIGLTIDRFFENWLEIEFADGTTAWTSGVVRDVSWNVGGETVRCDFHVLDDLCVDVILSKNYLFDLNVFSEHGECFFDTNSEEDFFQLCNIRLIGRYGDTLNVLEEEYLEDLTSPDAFGPDMVQRELARRDQIRDEISALPENEREAATEAEAERQRRWQDLRQAHRARWKTASSVPQSSNGHGNTHRTETYRDRTRTSERPPTEEVAGGGLQGGATRRTLWKKKCLENEKRHKEYKRAFEKDMEKTGSRAKLDWRIRGTNQLRNPAHPPNGDEINETRWMQTMTKFSDFLYRASEGKQDLKPVKIAIIDDGIDHTLKIFQGRIRMGESFHQVAENIYGRWGAFYALSGTHGTLMAKLICKICPNVDLYIAQLEYYRGHGGRRSFSAESAAEAINWAVSQGVDIISMSWHIKALEGSGKNRRLGRNQSDDSDNDRESDYGDSSKDPTKPLKVALKKANDNDVVMFCSSIDEGATSMDKTYPGANQKCIKIGASTNTGARLSWVSSDSHYLIPGDSHQGLVGDGDMFIDSDDSRITGKAEQLWSPGPPAKEGAFGSSVATALAAGLAGSLLISKQLVSKDDKIRRYKYIVRAFENLSHETDTFLQVWDHVPGGDGLAHYYKTDLGGKEARDQVRKFVVTLKR